MWSMYRHVAMLIGLLTMISTVIAADSCKDDALDTIATKLAIIEKMQPSTVRVEYTLKFDKGEAPDGSRGGSFGFSFSDYFSSDYEQLIKDQRPAESGGWLLSPTKVLTSDLAIHPRFIKSIKVRHGDQLVNAKLVGWARGQAFCLLELAKPLAGAKPLEFKSDANEPHFSVSYGLDNTRWALQASKTCSHAQGVKVTDGGRKYRVAHGGGFIVDALGTPVGFAKGGQMPLDEPRIGSPLDWDFISNKQMDELLKSTRKIASSGILHLTMHLRSPQKSSTGDDIFGGISITRYFPDDEDENESQTERHALALLVAPTKLLILSDLKPNITARLKRIDVHLPDGKTVPAKFAATIKDHGCLIATLDKPLDGAVALADGDIRKYRDDMLFAAEIRLKGQNRTEYFSHRRIDGFKFGWKRNIFPQIDLSSKSGKLFVFDRQGKLVTFPLAKRTKNHSDDPWRWHGDESEAFTSMLLSEVISDKTANIDPSNVPLSEDQENRLAWLGVEIQPLDKELARANNVSELSKDGKIGVLVSYVYPDSPAGKAGIEIGHILLRMHLEDDPKPVDVKIDQAGSIMGMFPWHMLGQMPDQYLEKMPPPWQSAENDFTRGLTDIGFGKKFELECVVDGKVLRKEMTVIQSPPHHGMARKFKSERLGMTVKDLTYEVRRHFHRADDDPGVIIAKTEPGSKASVSRMKRFEIVTHVNGKEVMNADDFEKLIAGQDELRFSVKRMDKGREVKIRLKSAATQPVITKPAEAL